jgi:hypothetical protein
MIRKSGFGSSCCGIKGIGGSLPRDKWLGHEANHSPPSSARLRIQGAIHPLPYASSWHGAQKV